jgi:hypothetical protein
MKSEIETLSVRVIKSLFDYCGSRGIRKLAVTCNHASRRASIPKDATPSERQTLLDRAPVTLGRLYRVSVDEKQARTIEDWRNAPRATVIHLMTVEYDGLKTLTISGSAVGPAQDPLGVLEF